MSVSPIPAITEDRGKKEKMEENIYDDFLAERGTPRRRGDAYLTQNDVQP